MLKTCLFFLLLSVHDKVDSCCKTVDETELMMPFLVHRHGDRSPDKREVYLSDDPEELIRKTKPYGYGQLNHLGKARSFILGKFIRRRYNQFLSPTFNSSDIFVRATASYRTQLTAKIAMTAAYSSKIFWSEDMELVPLDLIVRSAFADPNLPFLCPSYKSNLNDILNDEKIRKDMEIYIELLDILSVNLAYNVTEMPYLLYGVWDNINVQQSIGMPLSDLYQQLSPAIRQGAGLAAAYVYGHQKNVPLQAGVLLQEFFDTADQIIAGADIPKIRVLSGHDFNVYSFTAVTRAIPKQGVPGFCSVYSLELRRCKFCGKFFVVPVYLNSPDEPEAYLEIENCGVICPYYKFRALTCNNVLTERQYRRICNISSVEEEEEIIHH